MDDPRKYYNDSRRMVVLQAMILEDGFLVEYLPKDIYEESLND